MRRQVSEVLPWFCVGVYPYIILWLGSLANMELKEIRDQELVALRVVGEKEPAAL
jgi:hypothetical protein